MTTTADDRVGTITASPIGRSCCRCSTTRCLMPRTTIPTRCTANFVTSAPVYYNARRDLWVVSRYAGCPGLLEEPSADGQRPRQRHGRHPRLLRPRQPHRDGPPRPPAAEIDPSVGRYPNLPGISAGQRDLLASMREKGGGDLRCRVRAAPGLQRRMRLLGAHRVGVTVLAGSPPALHGADRRPVRHPGGCRSAPIGRPRHLAEIVRRARPKSLPAPPPTLPTSSARSCSPAAGLLDEERAGRPCAPDPVRSTDAPAALLTNCIAVLDKFPQLQDYLHDNPSMVKGFRRGDAALRRSC